MAQINLGNIYQSGGKTVVGGSASGIDTESIVKGLVEAKSIPVTKLQDKVDANTKVTSALSEMKKNLTSLKDSATLLRNAPGVNNAADNVFKYRKTAVTSSSGAASTGYLTATAQPGTALGNYQISVDQIATRSVKTTANIAVADVDTSVVGSGGAFNAGTLTLGASATQITLDDGDSLAEIAAKVNAKKGDTKVEAQVVKVSNGQYRLSFKTTATGADLNYDIQTPNAGIFNVGFATDTAATNAKVTVDGTVFERQTNAVSDVIEGMALNLTGTTPPATTLTLDVTDDGDLVKQGITNFVNAYNNLKLFVSKQSELGDDGLPKEDAVLANNSAVRTMMNQVSSQLSATVDALTAGDPNALASIGITFTDFSGDDDFPFTRNILTIDEDKLTSAIGSNIDGVQRLFELQTSTDNADVAVFRSTQNLSIKEFRLIADPANLDTGQRFKASYVDSNGVTQTIALTSTVTATGFTVTAPAESPLSGLTLLFAGNTPGTTEVKISQGVADRMANALTGVLSDDGGTLTSALSQVSSQSDRYKTEIERLNTNIEKFRLQLLDKYAALESAISSANVLLQQLQANADARLANS